jgi:hypothetical protein
LQSKNKPRPTVAEQAHIERLSELDCIVCGGAPVEIHEPEQGLWFASMPLCGVCHRDKKRGWHGERLNWKAKKWTELDAINATVRLLMT